jgi:hypothetical protein
MGLKPKYLWYCVPVIGFVLSFFFGFSPPKDWGAAMSFVAPVESWWAAHAVHPVLAAFFAGLLFGTVLLPEIWRIVRDTHFATEARPDWDLREAVDHLRVRSKWAIGRIYYTDKGRLLEEDIEEVLRDAASQGRIMIWGRPTPTGVEALFSRGTEIKVPFPDLQSMSLDLTTIDDSTAPNGAVLRAHSQDQYRFLRVNRREIQSEWPSASRARLFFDRTWKSRRRRITENVAEAHEALWHAMVTQPAPSEKPATKARTSASAVSASYGDTRTRAGKAASASSKPKRKSRVTVTH